MMDDIDRRTKEREAKLREQVAAQRRQARPEDYVFDKSQEKFWDLQDGTLNGQIAVDASIPLERWRVEVEEGETVDEDAPKKRGRPKKRREKLVPPSKDIMRVENDQFVEGATWWPGQPQIINDWFINKTGFFKSPGRRIYNSFKPAPDPLALGGDPAQAGPWVDHVKRLWPNPAEHDYFFDWCAHMVQHPEEKPHSAIVLSGLQGIGKDAALLPVKVAVGIWNSIGIGPDDLFSNYRPWIETLLLVVDEVRPTKDDFHASSMYNILKPLTASPPNTLPLSDKFEKLRYVINLMRVVLTTNDLMSMYVPPEDRRMFIMHSTLPQAWHVAAGDPDYFDRLFDWFERSNGDAHIAAWLGTRDLSAFRCKAPPPKTAAWEMVAGSWGGGGEDAVSAALDALGSPPVVFGAELLTASLDHQDEIRGYLKSGRKITLKMQHAGYNPFPLPDGEERWSFPRPDGGVPFRSRTVFVKATLAAELGSTAEVRKLIDARGLLAATGRKVPVLKAVPRNSF
jgi:hypothetical protein